MHRRVLLAAAVSAAAALTASAADVGPDELNADLWGEVSAYDSYKWCAPV